MSMTPLSLIRSEVSVSLRMNYEDIYWEGYIAAQNPSMTTADCRHITTRAITAWQQGFNAGRSFQDQRSK